LSISGTMATMSLLFLSLLFLEWIFDIDNEKKIEELTQEISEIKKRLQRSK